MPTDPIFLSPSMGFTDILQVASVIPYPSVIFIPVDDSNFLNSSTGNGAEPHREYLNEDTSASIGRCISSAAAVGNYTQKSWFPSFHKFPKVIENTISSVALWC